MAHRRGAIWTERLLLGLILVSLAGTLNLLVAIHRRPAASHRETTRETAAVAQTLAPKPSSDATPKSSTPIESPPVAPKPAPPLVPPEEDPTQKAIASLAAAKAKELDAAQAADKRASALEGAYRSAIAETGRWKRREMLVRQQIAGINAQAEKLEREADALDAERDVLERERDATKAALAKASKRSGFAVLPYKGPNGTWRRPIVIECGHGCATIQPHGPKFNALELSPRIHPRSSTFIKAIARELFHINGSDTPDGTPAVPYIVFLVRPDGVAPYYLARTCLEPLGIAFGYELVEQNLAINIPDFDDLTTWDGTVPIDVPLERAPESAPSSRRLAQANQPTDQTKTGLPGARPGDQSSMIGSIDLANGGRGRGGDEVGSSANSEPQGFVWPGRGRPAERNGPGSDSASRGGGIEDGLGGDGSTYPPSSRGMGGSELAGGGTELGSLHGSELAKAANGGQAGSEGTSHTAKAGGTKEVGSGGFDVGAGPGGGMKDQLGGTGSGAPAPLVNAEDIGSGGGTSTSLGANVGHLPSSGTAPVTDALGIGGTGLDRGSSSGSSGSDYGSASGGGPDLAQLPAFEPAGDLAGSRASLAQPGLLSAGGGSRSGATSGASAPAFGLGQTIKGSASRGGGDGSGGIGGRQQASEASTGNGEAGSGQGQGQGRGFDWKDAAKDNPAPAGSGGIPDSDQAPGQGPLGPDSGPPTTADAARANVAAGGALNRSSLPAQGELDPALSSIDASKYSQDDIERAKKMAPLSSLVSPRLAEKLAGAASALGAAHGTPSGTSATAATSDSRSAEALSSMPSNSDSSNERSGGMPLGGNTQPSTTSSASSSINLFGQNASASSNQDDGTEMIMPARRKETSPSGAIEARFEIVVVCRKDDVVLRPGGYRLTGRVLRSEGQGSDCILAREIRAMVRNRAMVDPLIRQKPALRFLVEQQGAETFALVRRQLLFSLPDWPVSLQVSGSQDSGGIFSRDPW